MLPSRAMRNRDPRRRLTDETQPRCRRRCAVQEDILTPEWRRELKMDRRSRRTRNALTAALMALLKEKPLKSVTVTELTERADVNRATFYVHFKDVFDMFDQVKLEFCDICRDLVNAHAHELARNENRPFLEDIFRYFAANEDAFATIFGENADGAFFSEVVDVVRDRCLAAVSPLDKVERGARTNLALGEALCNYQFDFLVSGIVSMLRRWLAEGRREPVELMVDVADSYMSVLDVSVLEHALKLAE